MKPHTHHNELTTHDHLNPDGTKERVVDGNQAEAMAYASHALRSEIANRRHDRKKLYTTLTSYSMGDRPQDEVQATLQVIHEQNKDIKDIQSLADIAEEETARENQSEF